ncbi:uncharacterized protein LOC105688422 [Athalia rosae]|uniref:uncharacterized protein LOC105688422 n=1 Tax=Athalia rosae TaxID=37344 RepID=UPI002033E582|nr:uncharacterized protein LOC105688422 [Athalia rosae]
MSQAGGSKGGLNDALERTARSNSGLNESNLRKSGKERNKEIVDIEPLVYSFRVPSNPLPGSVMNALLPPCWLYHDHAFGVIWMLFHQKKQYLGIAQLHWCLRFLLDLKNSEGEYTGDVNICIQAVQDDLIEQYAKLGTALENQESDASKSKKESSQPTTNDEISVGSSKKEKEGNEASSTPLHTRQSKLSELSACSSINESTYNDAQSLTYNQMISRGPAPYTEQTPVEQIYRAEAPVNMPTSTPDIAAILTSDTSPPDIPLTEMGTEELVSFLNCSRVEHVKNIKKEIEQLHELEKIMEGVDKEGFAAYVTDDFARRLDKLDGPELVREAETILK